MNFKAYVLITFLATALGLSVGLNFASKAQQPAPAQPARHWEYCVITRAGGGPQIRGEYVVRYLSNGSAETVTENATASGALAKKIAALGNAGWELTTAGPFEFKANNSAEALYFKRRAP